MNSKQEKALYKVIQQHSERLKALEDAQFSAIWTVATDEGKVEHVAV